jgi:thioredoxin-dependent peroxiredoxin
METSEARREANGKVQVGDSAPDFSLPTQDGKSVSLQDFRGQKAIVLYFYPKDDSLGCTTEACAFRDSYEVFKDAGAEVIGVSSDSEESHQRFASKHRLPFILASDQGGKLRKRYGVEKTMGILPGRVTYVIDKEGTVRSVFSSQSALQKHITEALQTLKGLS